MNRTIVSDTLIMNLPSNLQCFLACCPTLYKSRNTLDLSLQANTNLLLFLENRKDTNIWVALTLALLSLLGCLHLFYLIELFKVHQSIESEDLFRLPTRTEQVYNWD